MTPKRATMERMLQKGLVRVFLATTHPGVVVPTEFIGTAMIALNFSHRFAPFDLTLDDDRISSTLSFGGKSFGVEVPWGAVGGLMSPALDEFIQFEPDPNDPVFKLASGAFQPVEVAKFKPSVVPDEPGVTKTYSPPRTGHLRLLKN